MVERRMTRGIATVYAGLQIGVPLKAIVPDAREVCGRG